MAVRALRPIPKLWYAPNCHMYENVRPGHVFDGDIGVYFQRNGSSDDFEVVPSPTAIVPPKPPVALAEPVVTKPAVPAPEPDPAPPAPPVVDEDREPADEPFDPAAHSATAVLAHVKAHPDQAAAVRADELAGKQRMTILSALHD